MALIRELRPVMERSGSVLASKLIRRVIRPEVAHKSNFSVKALLTSPFHRNVYLWSGRLSFKLPWLSRSMSTESSSNSNCRQFYHPDCEEAINKQISQELHASLVYLSMAFYFDRDDVALNGFHDFFCKSSKEETSHAEMLMKYQNSRGGRIILTSIAKPLRDEWGSPADAIGEALALEKTVNESLWKLHEIASKHNDYHLEDFVEDYLKEQVHAIKQLADYSTNMKRVGPGLGEYIFDKEFPKSD